MKREREVKLTLVQGDVPRAVYAATRGHAGAQRKLLRDSGYKGPTPRLDQRAAGVRGTASSLESFRTALDLFRSGLSFDDVLTLEQKKSADVVGLAWKEHTSRRERETMGPRAS